MKKSIVVTLTGSDRVGLVDDVTKVILDHAGNIEASRMSRLGGEFAMLLLISVTEAQANSLEGALNVLQDQDFVLSMRQTERGTSRKFANWSWHQIEVRGADHEGIIHEITHFMANQGVSVETMDTGTEDAPFGGTKLFTMSGTVRIPPDVDSAEMAAELDAIGQQLNVDVVLSEVGD